MKIRRMEDAPTAAGEPDILILVEFSDESRTWICVGPTGEPGCWVMAMSFNRIGPDSEGWVVVDESECVVQRIAVLGWIPLPEVTQ